MISTKNLTLIIIVLIFPLFSIACTEKAEEKIGNEIGEKVLEKTLDEDVDIDTKDKNVSVENSDGSFEAGENLEWPSDKMNPLPNPKKNIVSVSELSEDNSILVSAEFDDSKEAREYLQDVKDLGYKQHSIEENGESFVYIGYKEDNTKVTIGYLDIYKTTQISMTRDSDDAKEFFKGE
ncbi:MAG: hypothetical protein ACTHVE_08475 [Senegalia sp. (in: firmicutes)]|uniref:hypothetical protein n=2 Tax=Senegalia sp. (in: firmicutes) TaxID=1924098 RepID=UPI003F9C028D